MASIVAPCSLLRPVSAPSQQIKRTASHSHRRSVSLRLTARCDASRPSSSSSLSTLSISTITSLLAASPAFAAEPVAQIADVDSRPLVLLLVVGPAVGWVLFNILQPALRQLDSMRSAKALIGAAALGAALAALTPAAEAAQEVAQVADVDARPLILLLVLGPAVGWVLFNILQPALRQLQGMINKK